MQSAPRASTAVAAACCSRLESACNFSASQRRRLSESRSASESASLASLQRVRRASPRLPRGLSLGKARGRVCVAPRARSVSPWKNSAWHSLRRRYSCWKALATQSAISEWESSHSSVSQKIICSSSMTSRVTRPPLPGGLVASSGLVVDGSGLV